MYVLFNFFVIIVLSPYQLQDVTMFSCAEFSDMICLEYHISCKLLSIFYILLKFLEYSTYNHTNYWNIPLYFMPCSLMVKDSLWNSHMSASPRPTTLEEVQEIFVDFS